MKFFRTTERENENVYRKTIGSVIWRYMTWKCNSIEIQKKGRRKIREMSVIWRVRYMEVCKYNKFWIRQLQISLNVMTEFDKNPT